MAAGGCGTGKIQAAERAAEILRGYAKLRPLVARDLDGRRLL